MTRTLLRLKEWCYSTCPSSVLMPLKVGKKEPLFSHKGGKWTWDKYDAFLKNNIHHTEWGILLYDLCVVDADDEATWHIIEDSNASWKDAVNVCPIQLTSKGRHYIFRRPKWADTDGYFDGARQSRHSLSVDLKTICSTKTAGLLVVEPSKGKRWLEGRAPWDDGVELVDIPHELMELVAKPRYSPSIGALNAHDEKVTAASNHSINVLTSMHDVGSLERLLVLISKTRWDDRLSWRNIATALRNQYGDDSGVKELWKKYSRQSSKYDAGDADKLWVSVARDDYTGPKITMNSIHAMAKHDDPVGYMAFRASNIPGRVRDLVKLGDRGLGKLAAELTHTIIKRTDNNTFYLFKEEQQAWIKCQSAKDLWDTISLSLEERLVDLEVNLIATMRAASNETERKALEQEKDQVKKTIGYIRSHSGMKNIADITGPHLHEHDFENRLDSVRHLLGVRNGVIDLRTGELRSRRPEDMIFTILDVEYDPNADDSVLRSTVLAAMADDTEMVSYLQKLLGYAITGEVSEEVFVVFTGSGRNCKGVLTQLLSRLLGQFYKELNPAIIVERMVSNVDAERGKLLGARLAVFNELKAGEKLKTNEVQLLSGGDDIPARPLYRDPMSIQPRHMCLLCTNHMPELNEVIPAMVERLLCIHFPVTFTNLADGEKPSMYRRQANRELKTVLLGNMSGTLKWLVEGAKAWYESKDLRRCAPMKVKEFSKNYLEEQDKLASFIRDHCVVGEEFKISTGDFIEAYNSLNEDGERINNKALASAMKMKGFIKKQIWYNGRNVQGFIGLGLKPSSQVMINDDTDI